MRPRPGNGPRGRSPRSIAASTSGRCMRSACRQLSATPPSSTRRCRSSRRRSKCWTRRSPKQPYLLGKEFTVADLNVAAVISRAIEMDLSATPSLKVWLQRCLERPAARKALALKAQSDAETSAEVTRESLGATGYEFTRPGSINRFRRSRTRSVCTGRAGWTRRRRSTAACSRRNGATSMRCICSACSIISAAKPARPINLISFRAQAASALARCAVQSCPGAARTQARRRGAGDARQGAGAGARSSRRAQQSRQPSARTERGRPKRSAAFDQLLELEPRHVQAHINRGNARAGLAVVEEALAGVRCGARRCSRAIR